MEMRVMVVVIYGVAGTSARYYTSEGETVFFKKISNSKLYSAFFASGIGCIAVFFNLFFKMTFSLALQLWLFFVLA